MPVDIAPGKRNACASSCWALNILIYMRGRGRNTILQDCVASSCTHIRRQQSIINDGLDACSNCMLQERAITSSSALKESAGRAGNLKWSRR
jgi:hypothetical protein